MDTALSKKESNQINLEEFITIYHQVMVRNDFVLGAELIRSLIGYKKMFKDSIILVNYELNKGICSITGFCIRKSVEDFIINPIFDEIIVSGYEFYGLLEVFVTV